MCRYLKLLQIFSITTRMNSTRIYWVCLLKLRQALEHWRIPLDRRQKMRRQKDTGMNEMYEISIQISLDN